MLPVLVIPRQPSVKRLRRKGLHCMHHEPVTTRGESGEANTAMWTTVPRDAASDAQIGKSLPKFRPINRLWCGPHWRPAGQWSRQPDSQPTALFAGLACNHVQAACQQEGRRRGALLRAVPPALGGCLGPAPLTKGDTDQTDETDRTDCSGKGLISARRCVHRELYGFSLSCRGARFGRQVVVRGRSGPFRSIGLIRMPPWVGGASPGRAVLSNAHHLQVDR
jgi:hypothetical protein